MSEINKNKNIFDFDRQYIKLEKVLVAGIDEAGRGPLAGPVVAACVILPENCYINDLDDSKKLTEKKRVKIEKEIIAAALDWSVAFASAKLIDQINILEATKMAMTIAYQSLRLKPKLLLMDAVEINYLPVKQHSIIKGDTKSAAIAAASVLAKQARDRYMIGVHEKYPLYGFSRHKGYPTKVHYDSLGIYGPCEEHRFSFKGVI